MEYKLHNGAKVALDKPFVRQYSLRDVADIEERIRLVSLRYYDLFPRERREIRYGRLPVKRRYDKAVCMIGRSMARQAIVEELVRDPRQPLPTLIATLACYEDGEDREHHAKVTLDQYLPGEGTNKALEHANHFSYDLLLPLFRIQESSWADALNNAGSAVFGRIDVAQLYLGRMLAAERKKPTAHPSK